MKWYRQLLIIVLTLITFTFALSYFSAPFSHKDDSIDRFSARRVADDIKIISKEPHSIEHPLARAVVRNYLEKRLEEMSISSSSFLYDSIKTRLNTEIEISNVFAKVNPISGDPNSFLLFVAHLDSRFQTKVLDRIVYSYGAADDGYGLGVILESVRLSLRYRENWKQGIKILFTDSEESSLDGIKSALKYNPEIFEKVGLVINIEARGVKGPALLFETSPENENIIRLYKEARHPFAYSISTLVYSILPNSSDFTLLKDNYPGMNFSVIDNLKYYHTDLDNYNNISYASLQHYGDQVSPVVKSYLTSTSYCNSGSINSTANSVFFTMPLFGLLVFSKNLYLIINILTLVLLCSVIYLTYRKNEIGKRGILKYAGYVLIFSFLSALAGLCMAYFLSVSSGQDYKLVYLPYIKYDWLMVIVALFLLTIIFTIVYLNRKNKFKFNKLESLIGGAAIQIILAIVLYIGFGENFFFLFPVLMAIAALMLNIISNCRVFYLFAYILILMLLIPFYYVLIVALTIGFLPVFLLLSTFTISLLIPLIDCFNRKLA